jgi:hypothetical protein
MLDANPGGEAPVYPNPIYDERDRAARSRCGRRGTWG